jgi:phage baseplate assembly protein W
MPTYPPFIVQIAPFNDVIPNETSDQYVNQLLVGQGNAVPTNPIVWTTTVPSPAFIVSSAGLVTTAALLQPGAYTVSGTMHDSNATPTPGTWTFTLTVLTEYPSPATSVIPVVPSQPLTPLGIEVMVPFQINPATGQVMTVNQYQEIIAQHVLSILMTAKGERVMLPTYGVGMQNYVFQPDTPLVEADIQSTIQASFKTWEPAVIVQRVSIGTTSQQPNVLTVTVTYSTTPYRATNTVTVSLGGSIPSAPITMIGQFIP